MRQTLLGLAVALCALACQPAASFQPEGACVADGRAPGTYPDLEARLPHRLGDAAPTAVDSGRSCTAAALSTYAHHGLGDVRYAGATWTEGAQDGTVIAVFVAGPGQPQLDQTWVQEFYETGARASTKTENIEIQHPTYDRAGTVYQLNTLNDLSFQSVVVWPGDGVIHVVIVATQLQPGGQTRADHDGAVRIAVLWAAGGPAA